MRRGVARNRGGRLGRGAQGAVMVGGETMLFAGFTGWTTAKVAVAASAATVAVRVAVRNVAA